MKCRNMILFLMGAWWLGCMWLVRIVEERGIGCGSSCGDGFGGRRPEAWGVVIRSMDRMTTRACGGARGMEGARSGRGVWMGRAPSTHRDGTPGQPDPAEPKGDAGTRPKTKCLHMEYNC